MKRCEDVGPWAGRPRAQMMKSDEVEAILHLRELGWGLRRIAREFGCSKNTVKRYVAVDGWTAYSRRTGGGKLEDEAAWIAGARPRSASRSATADDDARNHRDPHVVNETIDTCAEMISLSCSETPRLRYSPGFSRSPMMIAASSRRKHGREEEVWWTRSDASC